MNAADIIAARLAAAGVRMAFGIPGGEVLTLIDAMERAGIRFVLTKHENAAGFMAEGVWNATGAPGVLIATVGPGVANAFNVVANAEQDRVPLIVLSGCVDAADALSYNHQVFDHGAVLREVCKASFTAHPSAVDVMIDKAVGIALTGRPGPVHIDVPIRVADSEHPAPRHWRHGIAPPTAPSGADLEAAKAAFAAAERPVIMAGNDVLNEPGGPAAVTAFAERHEIPVLTTYKAKGIIPEDHPLSLGGHGLSPKADAVVLPIFDQADCIIAAGYDPIEMRTGWQAPWDPAKVIEFAHAANDHDMHHAAYSWVCSVTEGLAAIDGAPRTRWPGGAPAALRNAYWEAFAARTDWGPDQAIAEMLAAAPPETTITIDSGAHRILLSQQWQAKHPRAILQSTGLCTMGCALPLGMGFKLARPADPVIAFMGDAGLEMVLGEIGTLRDLGVPLVIVVFVDRSLALIELKQRRSGLQNAGVDFDRTRFAELARIYGGNGVTVSAPGEAGPALTEAISADRFTLIEVEIPRRIYEGLI
ncbi:MAG: thiamine pyrophosphate-binding protein [Pseudomonadota bacterium]